MIEIGKQKSSSSTEIDILFEDTEYIPGYYDFLGYEDKEIHSIKIIFSSYLYEPSTISFKR